MSNCETNFERLVTLFNDVFEGELSTDTITRESRLIEDLGMNSIGLLYMAVAVEEAFGVKFTNDDFASIRTVSDVLVKVGDA